MSAAPGTGIATRARAAIPTRWNTPTASTKTCSRNGNGPSATPPSPRSSSLNHVAGRFDLRRDITFGRRVDSARFDEAAKRWRINTDDGAALSAQFLIMATGCISEPNYPRIAGMDSFAGPIYTQRAFPRRVLTSATSAPLSAPAPPACKPFPSSPRRPLISLFFSARRNGRYRRAIKRLTRPPSPRSKTIMLASAPAPPGVGRPNVAYAAQRHLSQVGRRRRTAAHLRGALATRRLLFLRRLQ